MTDTRTRLLDRAEILFAEQGYAGTALRQIQTDAGVNSAAVHYHFGSKKALFTAVVERRHRPLSEQRLERLRTLEAEAGGAPVPLEDLIRAYFGPPLIQEFGAPGPRVWMKLLARFRTEPGDYWSDTHALHATVLPQYLKAFRRSLPGIPVDELKYRLFFVIGAAVNTVVDVQGLAVIDPALAAFHQDPHGVLDRLVRFAAAALRAPVA